MIHLTTFGSALAKPQILWDNIFNKGTFSDDGGASGDGSAENALNYGTYDRWEPVSFPARLEVLLSADTYANSIALVGHNIGSNSATVVVSYHNGTTWIEHAEISPEDDTTLVLFFPRVKSDNWRIRLSGAGDVPSVAYAILTDSLHVLGGVTAPHTPLHQCDEVTLLDDGLARNGQHIAAQVERVGGSTQINLLPEEIEYMTDYFEPFRQHFNLGRGFVFCTAPTIYPNDVGYCWRSGSEIKPSFDTILRQSISMGVRVYV